MTATTSVTDWMTLHGITGTVELVGTLPAVNDVGMLAGSRQWRVTISRPDHLWIHLWKFSTTDYYTGPQAGDATVAEWLSNTASMCVDVDNATYANTAFAVDDFEESFTNWCDSLGANADSRAEERRYRQCVKVRDELRATLTAEAYNELLWQHKG